MRDAEGFEGGRNGRGSGPALPNRRRPVSYNFPSSRVDRRNMVEPLKIARKGFLTVSGTV